ncbi:MAG: WG repeat-containing protein [Clostridia bacterium]|nr:WG repeat-containing protein [Clostridia bacterium]
MLIVDETRYNDAEEGLCGFVNLNGDVFLSSVWNRIWDFSGNMIARVEADGKFGYINEKGEYVIRPQWNDADDFICVGHQWVASVYEYSDSNRIWQGFINENNELLGERWYENNR